MGKYSPIDTATGTLRTIDLTDSAVGRNTEILNGRDDMSFIEDAMNKVYEKFKNMSSDEYNELYDRKVVMEDISNDADNIRKDWEDVGEHIANILKSEGIKLNYECRMNRMCQCNECYTARREAFIRENQPIKPLKTFGFKID